MKRMRVFAGPNGSGKSTLVHYITQKFQLNYGYIVNADDIEQQLRKDKRFQFKSCGFQPDESKLIDFFQQSSLAEKYGHSLDYGLSVTGSVLDIDDLPVNSYLAAMVADYIRHELVALGRTFSYETVLSDRRKLEFMQRAREQKYRIYLYYIATDSPDINISRVQNRVDQGGHDVPEDRIRERYSRSLDLLLDAIRLTDRCFLFDNSNQLKWIAEITNGKDVALEREDLPNWFIQYIEEKVFGAGG